MAGPEKTKEQIAEDRMLRELMMKEKMKKIEGRVDQQDPDLMKAIKLMIEDDEDPRGR